MTALEPAADDLRTPEQWKRYAAARKRILSYREFCEKQDRMTALERARRGERAPNGARSRKRLEVVRINSKSGDGFESTWSM